MISDLCVEFADTFIERDHTLVSRGFRRVSVATHDASDPPQHRAVILEPLVFCGADCVFDFHGDSGKEDEQVGDGKRVKLFNHFSEAAQQLPLPYLLRSAKKLPFRHLVFFERFLEAHIARNVEAYDALGLHEAGSGVTPEAVQALQGDFYPLGLELAAI